jgi:hypothetical protein
MPRGSVDGWIARLSREYEEQAIYEIKVPARECQTQKSSLSRRVESLHPERGVSSVGIAYSSRACGDQRGVIDSPLRGRARHPLVRLLPTLCEEISGSCAGNPVF